MTTYMIVRGNPQLANIEEPTHIIVSLIDTDLDLTGWRGTHAQCLDRARGLAGPFIDPMTCSVPGAVVWPLLHGAVVVTPIDWVSEARDWLLDRAARCA